MSSRLLILSVAISSAVLTACATSPAQQGVENIVIPVVPALVETAAVASGDDAADDPAVLRLPSDKVVILGTNKRDGGGLYRYNLDGSVAQFLPLGPLNNVDARLDPRDPTRAIVVASHRRAGLVEILDIEPQGDLFSTQSFRVGLPDPYGICIGNAPGGSLYVGVTNTDDGFEQWRLDFGKDDLIEPTKVRALTFGSQAEGCVFDDVAGHLYIAVEDRRIDRFAALPDEGDTPVTIASVDGRTVFADLEGLTLFEREGQSPLLIASSQGNSSFLVYDTANSALIGRFRIGAGPDGDLDAVTETDGIAVLSGSVEGFSGGLFIAQDDVNLQASGRKANQNYKFVAWSDIEAALSR